MRILPSGQRAGFFIGDAAGVGKGRQVTPPLLILDYMKDEWQTLVCALGLLNAYIGTTLYFEEWDMFITCFIVQNDNTSIVTTIFYHILKLCKCLPKNICLPSNMNNRFLTSSIGWVSFQIAGIILDNYARGRTKHIWFTISSDLIVDSRRWELIKLTSLDYYCTGRNWKRKSQKIQILLKYFTFYFCKSCTSMYMYVRITGYMFDKHTVVLSMHTFKLSPQPHWTLWKCWFSLMVKNCTGYIHKQYCFLFN